MLNKLERFLREQKMVCAGETVVCAVSGGADSVALLFTLYLLKEKLGIQLEAAHFNHHLRGDILYILCNVSHNVKFFN